MAAVRTVMVGDWQVRLYPPSRICEGSREQHLTRPNLCRLDGAIAMICQTTFDTSATVRDAKDIWISTDGGGVWQLAAAGVDIGSYALHSCNDGKAVVMPYDSLRFGHDDQTLRGSRTTLTWNDLQLQICSDETVLQAPEALKRILPEPILGSMGKPLYLDDDLPPPDKPITAFWGTIQSMDDGRWVVPVYGCYAKEPYARDNAAPEMRRLGKFTTELFTSSDEGRHWSWYARIATPQDVPDSCVEGPSEVQLYQFGNHWRAIFRTSALKNFFQPLHYSESWNCGRDWEAPKILPGVDTRMDPRGLRLSDGTTVLTAGRPKVAMYLAAGSSLYFHTVDLTSHHNHYHPRLKTTGHSDVIALDAHNLLVVYDSIPDGWRWPGSTFTAPDAIYGVRVEIYRHD